MKILKNNSGQYSFSLWLGGRLTPVSAGKQVRIPDMDVADVRRQIEAFGFLSLEDAVTAPQPVVQREVPVALPVTPPPVEPVKEEKLELLCTVEEPVTEALPRRAELSEKPEKPPVQPATKEPVKPAVKKAAPSKTQQRGRPKKAPK